MHSINYGNIIPEGFKVVLAPSFAAAEAYIADYGQPEATVEAEYGDAVISGSMITLAHHGPRCANPAPCVADVVPLKGGGTILVSHIDLDTLGGIMAIMGVKPDGPIFWESAAYIDVHGPHHSHEIPSDIRLKLNAWWGYCCANTAPRDKQVSAADITASLEGKLEAIQTIVTGKPTPVYDELMVLGANWAETTTAEVTSKLVGETSDVRWFITDGVFCSSSYYSHSKNSIAKATVVLNTKFEAITIAFEDGGKTHSAKTLVQSLWGAEAGGRDAIAGSPRNWGKNSEELSAEFDRAVKTVLALYA